MCSVKLAHSPHPNDIFSDHNLHTAAGNALVSACPAMYTQVHLRMVSGVDADCCIPLSQAKAVLTWHILLQLLLVQSNGFVQLPDTLGQAFVRRPQLLKSCLQLNLYTTNNLQLQGPTARTAAAAEAAQQQQQPQQQQQQQQQRQPLALPPPKANGSSGTPSAAAEQQHPQDKKKEDHDKDDGSSNGGGGGAVGGGVLGGNGRSATSSMDQDDAASAAAKRREEALREAFERRITVRTTRAWRHWCYGCSSRCCCSPCWC